MAAKEWSGVPVVKRFTWDFSVHGGATGTIALGNLPDKFIVTKVVAVAETAPVGGGSMIVGEDGSGDADGYFTDLDAIATTACVTGTGALVREEPATANEIGNEKSHQVDSAKDGVLMTIATTAYTAGKIHFNFLGFQG